MISIIHPSRSRIQKAINTANRWINEASEPLEYIVSIDADDPDAMHYYGEFKDKPVKIKLGNNRSAIDAINNAAKECTGDIIIVVSDDFDCPSQWATSLLRLVGDRTDWIAKTHDGIQRWIITLPIMDRVYYNRFGYVYHPDFLHMFCDTEMTAVADLLGRKINLDMKFPHNHYSVGKAERDEISIRADNTWGHGEYTFMKHYRNNFGLVDPPGKITDQNFLNWVSTKR